MGKHADFTQSVISALNTMYTTHSTTSFIVNSRELGIRVEITNVAAEEIGQLKDLLDANPHWYFGDGEEELSGPVGNQKLEEATAEMGHQEKDFPQPIRILRDGEFMSSQLLASLDHVHTEDGHCFKNRYGVKCPSPKSHE